jgi:short-chain Z-isoprenyl diphosphate synthase
MLLVMRASIKRILTKIYGQRLLHRVLQQPAPRHVGIVLDGNRRHGRDLRLTDPHSIYALGAEKLDDVLTWCAELRIPAVTLWVLSTDNLCRPPEEVSGILAAIENKLIRLVRDPRPHHQGVRVRAVGRLDLLPSSTRAVIQTTEEATRTYQAMTLTIAVAYGGREEISDAVKALLKDKLAKGQSLADVIEQVTPAEISQHLYSAELPDPDLIIRTSGEIRLSGFLLWQSAHSEFYFSDVYWPAFRKIDFLRAVRAYQQRNRRFGS